MEQQITKLDGDKKVGVRSAKKYEVNPFIDRLVVKTRGRRVTVARGSTLMDVKTGEIEGVTEIAQIVEVDEGQFVKLFTKDLAIWFDLNKSAMRVFGALLATVQKESIGRDLVFFDHTSEQTKKFGMSKQTFYRGVEELIEKGFIARHRSAGWYFINPAMFFNGNRARFVKEYQKVLDKPKALKNDTQTLDMFIEGHTDPASLPAPARV